MTYTLPGITFQTQLPAAEDALPRMDIAALVGFAASGPVNVPVLVEDVAQFRDLFGTDLPLAWDAERGQLQYAHLGPAVEAFFRNGGRRCWVVRVADDPVVNRFPVPGLVDAATLRPAVIRARCGGSWSDDLQVGAVQETFALGAIDFELRPNGYRLGVNAPPGTLVVGDLIEVRFEGSDLLLYVFTERITASARRQIVEGRAGIWFLRFVDPSSPPLAATAAILLHPDGEVDLPLDDVQLPSRPGGECQIDLALALEEAPDVGTLLRLDFADHPSLLCPISAVTAGVGAGSPPDQRVRLSSAEPLWTLREADGRARSEAAMTMSPPEIPLAARLRFRLLAWREQELSADLVDLGFAASHPRFWGVLPDDQALFARPTGEPRPRPVYPFEAEVTEPRFPLADAANPALHYLPLGMALAPAADRALSRLIPADEATPLERDGVAAWGAPLFVDERLAGLGVRSLLAQANDLYYLQDESFRQDESNPELSRPPLTGIHSLLPIGEASLVAVPDAIHGGWEQTPTPLPEIVPAPTLLAIDPLSEEGHYRVRWTEVSDATDYVLESDQAVDFPRAQVLYAGSETETEIFLPADCPQPIALRVRARRRRETSPWSNTITTLLPSPQFVACPSRRLGTPTPTVDWPTSPPSPDLTVQWNAVPGATRYRLEESIDPLFRTTTTVIETGATAERIRKRDDTVYFYRVRAERNGEVGAWSVTRAVSAAARLRWTIKPLETAEQTGTLLAIQRALLRFCAGRGDMLAVLSLPRSFRTGQAQRYLSLLLPRIGLEDEPGGESIYVPPLSLDEKRVMSYSALYHPWILAQPANTDLALRWTPPDGVAVGLLAQVALDVGAWRAPANRPLRNVLALAPNLDRVAWADLFAAQVNLVRFEAGGAVVLSEETLSLERDLQPIHVRRLMILLRRLALREGNTYVFAPTTPEFRRQVQHRFERILARLHLRGAFAGPQPEQAYRVITDSSVNPPASLDQGRFIVELQVAPAQSLVFLTVRLLQKDRETLVAEEV